MTEENPYQAPATSAIVAPTPRRWRLLVLPLVCLQALLAALYVPLAFERFRNGEISVIEFLPWFLANVALAFGGFRLLRTPKKATYLFATSAVLAGVAYLQWRPPNVRMGFLIAVFAALISLVSSYRSAKA